MKEKIKTNKELLNSKLFKDEIEKIPIFNKRDNFEYNLELMIPDINSEGNVILTSNKEDLFYNIISIYLR